VKRVGWRIARMRGLSIRESHSPVVFGDPAHNVSGWTLYLQSRALQAG
jgi:hypothetical protein